MTPLFTWLAIAGGGFVLGLLHFGGLWLSLRLLRQRTRPALWLLASSGLRITVSLGGLWWLMAGAPLRLLAALGGFILARWLLSQRLGGLQPQDSRP